MNIQPKVHEFRTDLSASWEDSRKDYWVECYRTFFPSMYSHSLHDNDPIAQQHGIDRKLFLGGGKIIGIDEKVRGKDYGDILLEEFSSYETQTPGWIEKPQWCDYISYAIPCAGKCFLLPFQQLQTAWRRNKEEWKSKYFRVQAVNKNYTTISWAVPIVVVYQAIAECMITTFTLLK